jgi:uncharacterized phage protein (TIGR02218 family)
MTFEIIENSQFRGQPVDLYEFVRGTNIWRYTSADEDKSVDFATYKSYEMSRSAIDNSQDIAKSHITIKATTDNPFAYQFIASSPSDVIDVVIKQYHETDVDNQVVTLWNGRVVNVKFVGNEVQIRCEPQVTSMNRNTLRRLYQPECPHVLYGSQCRADELNFLVNADVDASTGNTITSSTIGAYSDGYFSGGYIEWDRASYKDRRSILDHVGDTITLNGDLAGIDVGDEVAIYPGCAHNMTACKDKFNNLDNYGGFAWLSVYMKNPMGGDSVF